MAFNNSLEAELARQRLEGVGVRARLSDAMTVDMVWSLTGALGGVKLLVDATEAAEARRVLATPAPPTVEGDAAFDELGDSAQWDHGDETVDDDLAEQFTPSNPRETLCRQSLRGAIAFILYPPLQLYVTWLLFQVFFADEPLRSRFRFQARWAAIINGLFVFLCLVILFDSLLLIRRR